MSQKEVELYLQASSRNRQEEGREQTADAAAVRKCRTSPMYARGQQKEDQVFAPDAALQPETEMHEFNPAIHALHPPVVPPGASPPWRSAMLCPRTIMADSLKTAAAFVKRKI
jgi:hypothetical protein